MTSHPSACLGTTADFPKSKINLGMQVFVNLSLRSAPGPLPT